MRFNYELYPQLPRLSWCAKIQADNDLIDVKHGDGVEVLDSFFVEGAWNGPFTEGRFDIATMFVGCGAVIVGDAVLFVPPSHPLERLHSIHVAETLFVSNSLVGLIVAAGREIDPGYPFYQRDCMSILQGLSRSILQLPTAGEEVVRLHYCHPFRVSKNLAITRERRRFEQPFTDFHDYVDRLSSGLEKIVANASSSSRGTKYGLVTAVSSGYDSPAVSALAKAVGCPDALTILDARPDFNVDSDSGVQVGKALGLDVTEFSRNAFREMEGVEDEFFATASGGEDMVMATFGPSLKDRVFFTGFRGDTVWDGRPGDTWGAADFVQKDPSGASLGEFRLRTGFIHVPVPALTYAVYPSLRRISNSAEMLPWSVVSRGAGHGSKGPVRWLLHRRYDRPIPRRIAEEAGVPGDLFGIVKAAITEPLYHGGGILGGSLSAEAAGGIQAYYNSGSTPRSSAGKIRGVIGRIASYVLSKLGKVLSELGAATGLSLHMPNPIPLPYQRPVAPWDYAFHWSANRIAKRYEVLRPEEDRS